MGGRVALIGPNVTNAGTISTPDGQTILAAGEQVGFSAHAEKDPTLRGLDVQIGTVGKTDGVATSSGLIEIPEGDVTIAGKTVNQLGGVNSATSVASNGRIDLIADYGTQRLKVPGNIFALEPSQTGVVTLGPNSVSQILPDLASTAKVVGTQLALPSLVDIEGRDIHMAAGATLLAPGAAIPSGIGSNAPRSETSESLVSGVTLNAGAYLLSSGQYFFQNSTGQIYLDGNAEINVAGSAGVAASVDENIVPVQLRGPQLENSPLQRNGLLRGKTVQIDIRQTGLSKGQAWVGTPLADTAGFVNLIQRSVGELTTNGGSVSLTAGGSVVAQPGSIVNVSGGSIDFQGGIVQTTRVQSGGILYDISQASPDLVYDGIYTGQFTTTHERWGISNTFTGALTLDGAHFEQGYTQGGAGGSIAITAPSTALDGRMLGNTVAGPQQRNSASAINAVFGDSTVLQTVQAVLGVPSSSSFALTFEAQKGLNTNVSPTPPAVVFGNGGNLQPAAAPFHVDSLGNAPPLSASRRANVFLSADLASTDGFSTLSINNGDGSITVLPGANLSAEAGGSINLSAANIDVEGSVTAPGGSLSFTSFNFSPFSFQTLSQEQASTTPAASAIRGNFTLGSRASLSTAGLIVDDRGLVTSPDTLPLITQGGSVAISAYGAQLRGGSTIDVSGGFEATAAGGSQTPNNRTRSKIIYGNGGSILVKTGADPEIASLLFSKKTGGQLVLASKLLGFSGAAGGSVGITAPFIQVGGQSTVPDTLALSPAFFSEGGFSSFSLTGIGSPNPAKANQFLPALVVAPGTVIRPIAEGAIFMPTQGGGLALSPISMPAGERSPVNLSFSAPGVNDTFTKTLLVRGDIVVGAGSIIQTDPQTNPTHGVSIVGQTVAELGSIIAPGGTIAVQGSPSFANLLSSVNPLATVELGSQSLLSTAGATALTPDPRNFRTGKVLPGGTITVAGNIVAEAGSRLDVSGASDTLFEAPTLVNTAATDTSTSGSVLVPTHVESNAGAITLRGGQELFSDATLVGKAGGPETLGGSLTVSSSRFLADPTSEFLLPTDVTLQVTQNGPTIAAQPASGGATAIGRAVLLANGKPATGFGHIAVSSFAPGGFASLNLKGTVGFVNPVSIATTESITVADSGVLFANAPVTLQAPYVKLGQAFLQPQTIQEQTSPFIVPDANGNQTTVSVPPQHGAGSLTVIAKLIDVGTLSLQGIGRASLIAEGGDIRGDGTLDIAGQIEMVASQIYPPTATIFSINAYDYMAGGKDQPGTVTFAAAGRQSLPLSAGGVLDVHGSVIEQGGVLRAPIGAINLGWNGVGTAPIDPITGQAVDATRQLILAKGSQTSVSAVDPVTGKALTFPYGINLNGVQFIDPTGTDIFTNGVPAKTVNLSAVSVNAQAGSVIDIAGGGDLFAYRFVSGLGGTKDILNSTSSYAIIPGFQSQFAPFGQYNSTASVFGSDAGYFNSKLVPGTQVFLQASNGLPAGAYTLLPARYALLPGAFLVTPVSGTPVQSIQNPNGSSVVSGYSFNAFNPKGPVQSLFEVDPQSVVRSRAEYDNTFANAFLASKAVQNNINVPRLPIDAGQLVFQATKGLAIQGTVLSQAPAGGLGGLVDISSPNDILIASANIPGRANELVLNATELSSFNAASLLIGGLRTIGSNGTEVSVTTNSITVDNAGSPLSGEDVILVAKKSLVVDAGSEVEGSGAASSPAETLLIGDSKIAGSGDGVLLRVGSDPSARIARTGVDTSTVPTMTVAAGALISGASVTLDSTHATNLSSRAILKGSAVNLDSGQISLQLNNPGALVLESGKPTSGLILSGAALKSLETSAQALSLLSYSSIDIYGTGNVGSLASVGSLALHTAEIRGFNTGAGAVTFAARSILLDNSASGSTPGSTTFDPQGALVFDANTIRLGANPVSVDQYGSLRLAATGAILAQSSGALAAQGNLSLSSADITGASAANYGFTAGGGVNIQASKRNAAQIAGGLGASLSFAGSSVIDDGNIDLPSGIVSLRALTGNVTVGGGVNVNGLTSEVFDVLKFTSGGQINLVADAGSVNVAAGALLNVSGPVGGGNAGSVSISAPGGVLGLAGRLSGIAGAGGQNGSFTLDVGTLASLGALDQKLNADGFTLSRSIRVQERGRVGGWRGDGKNV